jgi:hypothetical protein
MATKELKDHKAPEEMQSSLIFASFAIFCGSLLRSFLLRLFAPFCGNPLGSPSLRFFAFFCGHLPRPPSLRFFVPFCGYTLLLLLWLLVSPALAASDPNLAGGAGKQPKPNRYGPFRNDPAQGIPKHAYSPFDDIGKPPPYTPAPGRDYKEGELVIKFKPHVAVQKAAMGVTSGAWRVTSDAWRTQELHSENADGHRMETLANKSVSNFTAKNAKNAEISSEDSSSALQ